MIQILLREAGRDFVEACRLFISWVGCRFSHHDWCEYVDEWDDGEVEVTVECWRCRARG